MAPSFNNDLFVGRASEMAELSGALDGALEGRGGLVMLVGEPGIGKTRLAEELAAAARRSGAQVAWGACYEGGSAPPLWPWIQAIRSLLTEPSEATMSALESRATVIAEIIPEISNVFSALQRPPELESGQARFRLFESIGSFLNEAAASQPIVLVLDDLHWADRVTLDLLEFVARDIASNSLLLIGGYRDMEISRRHPLSETLANLGRVRGFNRILLRGLVSSEVGVLVDAVGHIPLPTALIEEIRVRTEGNPFFITEVTRDLAGEAADRGGDFDAVKFRVPEGVREAIGIRLNRLSEECNDVLQTAAVIGREFDFWLLTALRQDIAEEKLLHLIEEAAAAGALREARGTSDRYEFTHALIEQTLAEELTTGRRVRLHARIIDAMEELYADRLHERVAELAHHCAEAETVVGGEKIVQYARLAGEQAVSAYAWIEARAYFEQALEALGDREPEEERAAILSGLGRAELLTLTYPDIQRGWEHTAEAFKLYDDLGDSGSAVRVAIQSRGFPPWWLHGRADVYARALEMVAADSVDAGYLHVNFSEAVRFDRMDAAGSHAALEQAREIAIHAGDKRLETLVLKGLSRNRVYECDYRGAAELLLKSLELVRETDQPIEEAGIRLDLADALKDLGDPDAATVHMEALRRLEERLGIRTISDWSLFLDALYRGDLAEANSLGEGMESEYPDDSVTRLVVATGAWHSGGKSDIDDRFRAAQEEAQTAPTLWQRSSNHEFTAFAAKVMDRRRDAIQAAEHARSVLSEPRLVPEIERHSRIAVALAAIATGDAEEALEQYKWLAHLQGIMY